MSYTASNIDEIKSVLKNFDVGASFTYHLSQIIMQTMYGNTAMYNDMTDVKYDVYWEWMGDTVKVSVESSR